MSEKMKITDEREREKKQNKDTVLFIYYINKVLT